MKVIISVILITAIIAGCKHHPDGVTDLPWDPPVIVSDCDPDTVYFVNDILPLITSSCASPDCHDADNPEEGIQLTDYAHIINDGEIEPGSPWEGELIEKIMESDPDDIMPPPPFEALTSDEIAMIQTWISQGALNNGCTGGCDTTNVTFAGSISGLVATYCEGCHSGGSPSGGLSLTNYGEISASALDGSLLSSLLATNGYELMPYGSSPLLDCQIDMIEIWINDGAPNN